MGYLTTVTIYNDSADQLMKHPEELAEKLDKATKGVQINRGHNTDSLGNAGNLLTLQTPRHADDHTLYLHAGNTVIDVWTVKDDYDSDWAINVFIYEMEYHIKRLKAIRDGKQTT